MAAPVDSKIIRDRVITAARGWLGTPFHNDAQIKGVGVDCAQFVAASYLEAGAVPAFVTPRYTSQWFMNQREETLKEFVESVGGKRIDEARAMRGDLVLYKMAHVYAHAAIIIEWPTLIIHAHLLSKKVIEMPPFEYDMSRHRDVIFYSIWG